MKETADIIWKVLIGGEGGVGKTTILHRFISNEFVENMNMTIGVQFHIQTIQHHGKNIQVILWDLGGQERFRFLQPEYCKGAVGAFALFDMSRIETLKSTVEWVDLFRKSASKDIPIMLVGTKRDVLQTQQEVDEVNSIANEYASSMKISGYAETSAKFGWNVSESIYCLLDLLLKIKGFE